MSDIYFSIEGTNHWHGQKFIEPGMEVFLKKGPDNEVDKEATKNGFILYRSLTFSNFMFVLSDLLTYTTFLISVLHVHDAKIYL